MDSSKRETNRQQGFPIEPAKGIRNSQIICIALLAGLSAFFVVAVIASKETGPAHLSYIGLGLGVVQIVISFVVPGIVARSQAQRLAATSNEVIESELFAVFQTKMIIGLALLEGAGFFNLVCYMSEGQWWTLAFTGFLMLLMAMRFPTLRQFESWADDKKRDLQNQF